MIAESIVVDTNGLSYIIKAHPFAALYEPILDRKATVISFQTVLELRYGAYSAGWGERRIARLEQFIETFTVIQSNDAICTRCAKLLAVAEHKGRTMQLGDALIAATALELRLPLVTHNKRHFDFIEDLMLL